jgi:copper chaperone CopZ
MRKFLAVAVVGFATALLSADGPGGGAVEVKGPHLCCKQCVKVASEILKKVDGVADIKADPKTKAVSFTAKDDKAAQAGVKALFDGGFFGKATEGGKELKVDAPAPKKGDKANVVTVKDVHVCCGACKKAIEGIFKDAKVSYEGNGPQRTVRIEGNDLDRAEVLETLRNKGFNGSVEK